ncbi:hypothetical protein FsymDg_2789 [Candidatus Protofrankia datiscae]|uniref:Uncharacterized protein n=1 Tax=Candidatus Protofrankia datiscae TaxID=2716812 RepID=F8B4Z3_9ACTN|nr:hypothetical protein FsymDg_2789 [Candidatus Protofrankia datiscae]
MKGFVSNVACVEAVSGQYPHEPIGFGCTSHRVGYFMEIVEFTHDAIMSDE